MVAPELGIYKQYMDKDWAVNKTPAPIVETGEISGGLR
jgi:hypothetical protein